ncbi:MAG: hypothetical protein DRP45_09015, partial [Candidatus Zixiibacteriota bacterium]
MRSTLLMITILVLFAATFVSAERVELGMVPGDANAIVLESDDSRTVVRFEVGAFEQSAVDINGNTYYEISCNKEHVLLNAKEPSLPRLCRSIIIPDDAHMKIAVLSSEYVDIPRTPVAPSKGNLMRNIDPQSVPYEFGAVYQTDEWYPSDLATLREPFIQRDYRGTVIELNAFQYNPSSQVLRVYTSVTVEVTSDGPGLVNVLRDSKRDEMLAKDFDLLYERRFINYASSRSKYTSASELGDLLIITHDDFADEMAPLVEWKMQKGIKTTMVNVSEIGNNSADITAFIQDFYDTTNIVFVLLVGDHNEVNKPDGSGNSDPVYGKVAGSDDYIDIFLGRFSAETSGDVITQVERSVEYELNPIAGDWFHKAIGVGSNDPNTGQGGEHDWEHEDLIRDDLLAFTYTEVDRLYEHLGATSGDVTNALQDGRTVVNYTGHGAPSGWSTTGFGTGDVEALQNDNMLPFVVHVACNVSQFYDRYCFGEAWQRSTNNVNGEPTGGVAGYGSIISQGWSPPMDCQDEIVDLYCAEAKTSIGGLCYNGSSKMIELNGSTGVSESRAWTLLGDPSIQLRTDTPAPLIVIHDAIMLFTATSFNVTVSGVEGALCAIYHNGILYGSAWTDATGFATIPLGATPPVGETVTLTVTAFNAATFQTGIQVISPSGPYVVYDYHDINDASGNNNGLVDNGESILLGLQLQNVGPDDALDVNATITTLDSYVIITDGTEAYGTILGNFGTSYIADGFAFDVANNCPDDHMILFDLEVTGTARDTWTGTFSVPVHAPDIAYLSVVVDDAIGGNDNGMLDPGETAILTVTLENTGSATAFATSATLSATDINLTVDDGSGYFGDIVSSTSGNNSGDTYQVTADESTPMGYLVMADLAVTSGAYTTNLSFSITIGDRVVIFGDDFSWDQGWTGLGGDGEWEMTTCNGIGGDPSDDHSPSGDNR